MRSGRKKKIKVVAPKTRLSKQLTEEIIQFMEHHPAARVSHNLRSMLLDYLQYQSSTESLYFLDLVHDLEGLFALLDEMEEHNHASTL